MISKELKKEGKRIFYRVIGKGEPVMLIHGFGETGDVWNNQVEFLKDNFCLIVPDLPGSGQSDMIADMSMEGLAEIIKAILDAEAAKDSLVIGHSMGGYILLAFVEQYAADIRAFGLFHSSAFADTEEKKVTRRKGIEFINQHGAFEFLKNSTPNLFSEATKDKSPALISGFIDSLNNFSAAALVSYYEAMMKRPDRTQLLKETKLPVLFVMGEYDNAVPLEDGLKQCHLPEKAYIHILRQSGHMGMLEESGKANRLLAEFLQASVVS